MEIALSDVVTDSEVEEDVGSLELEDPESLELENADSLGLADVGWDTLTLMLKLLSRPLALDVSVSLAGTVPSVA